MKNFFIHNRKYIIVLVVTLIILIVAFLIGRFFSERFLHRSPEIKEVKVTIPEGFNISDIAQVFASKLPNFNKDKFILNAKNKEGYLFPDTYLVPTTATAQTILSIITNNFNSKFTEALYSQRKNKDLTKKQVLILASLVERQRFSPGLKTGIYTPARFSFI